MADNRSTIKEINELCSPNSILIIDRKGILRRLQCPFRVLVLNTRLVTNLNTIWFVDAVKLDEDLLMLYIIQSKAYPYHYFAIIL